MRGLMASLAGRKDVATSTDRDGWFYNWATGGAETLSGVSVTPDSAMRLSAVWACVRIRSEDVGKLPCFLYQRLPDGGKRRAVDHPLYSLIRDQPNPYQTAFEFRQLMQAWIDLRGNAYAWKEYDLRGQVIALWPLNPTWVTVLRVPESGELFYQLNIPGQPSETVPAEAIIHLRGLTLDGYCGVSPITYHRETIGLGIAAQKYGAAFFGNSARPDGILTVPTVLTKPAGDALRAEWDQKFKGVEKAKKLAIFDGGMKWEQVGMDNTDAQYLETRKFQNQQIYSMYRMPAHKAGDLERSTNNNIEHQALEYVTDCLGSELTRWEQTLKRDLLMPAEKSKYFFEFLRDALLIGDLNSRYQAYAVARNWGILCVNDCRERENLNHIPNGNIFLQPLNMVEAGTVVPIKPSGNTSPDTISPSGAKALLKLAMELVAREEAELSELPWPPKPHNGNGSRVNDSVDPHK